MKSIVLTLCLLSSVSVFCADGGDRPVLPPESSKPSRMVVCAATTCCVAAKGVCLPCDIVLLVCRLCCPPPQEEGFVPGPSLNTLSDVAGAFAGAIGLSCCTIIERNVCGCPVGGYCYED